MTNPEIKQTAEFATIESYVHDQGGGFSWCSSCKTPIDIKRIKETMRCPNSDCNKLLKWGGVAFNRGGSDF